MRVCAGPRSVHTPLFHVHLADAPDTLGALVAASDAQISRVRREAPLLGHDFGQLWIKAFLGNEL